MDIIEKKITTKDYLTKSNLPASDYVINPYVGCPHACKYCYASFMKRFTGHREKWGSFIDIKECDKPVNIKKLQGKSIFLSSVTDCYNPFEEKYRVTRNILEQLVGAKCQITISTKSNLILRDIDLLKKLPDLKVAFSVNTLDEEFRKDMDIGSTIAERIVAMKKLHREGIYTVLFMSPIFPYITDCKGIIDATKDIACEYWFENLNLRGAYKQVILDYIDTKYPSLKEEYRKIYIQKDTAYWKELGQFLQDYGEKSEINSINYFYHEKLIKEKKGGVANR
ncbi:MAG: radical SAM protein [Lachnospiraceae bacterium]|nr:radical SAM protein [Lachnospiraceae bacterium]